jgi:hypothetical protein
VQEFNAAAAAYLTEHKDEYGLAAIPALHATVGQRAKEVYEKTGKILTEQEAAAIVEKELDGVIEGVLKTKKWQTKIAEMVKGRAPEEAPRQAWEPRPRRSIGNDMTPGPSVSAGAVLTSDQKRDRAIARLRELKSQP